MLPTLNLKRVKPDDQIESSDQAAVAVAPAAEESCPAPDARPARDSSLRMEPRFSASSFSTPDFTAERITVTAERIVPRVDAERLISRVDTERLAPRVDAERLTARTDSIFPSAEFPSPANDLGPDLGPVEHQPSIRLDTEPSAFAKAMKRALTGFVIVVGGAIATVGWQNFGDDARQLAKGLTPNLPLVSWLHLKHQDTAQTAGAATASATSAETADASAQAPQDTAQAADTPPADSSQQQAAAADQQAAPQQPAPQQAAAPQPAPAAPAATDTTATAPAAPSAEVTQLTQSVQALTREVASLQKAMAELKTNNEQMSRDIAKLNERNTARRATTAPKPAPTAQAQRPAAPPPVHSSTTPRPVSQYQPPARPYPVSSQEAATQPHSLAPPPPVYSQPPASPPPSYAPPRTYYSDPSGYADSSPAPRPPATVP
ncbi:hypothetical protein [Bradyrhizobium sp. SYSU BS000235]|uniref:hypothetical protein n=1 Tax=Bradyrhizobium sp. SYSU BS000235 TaxID=3411332 RepID=UPI003C75A502